MAMSWFSKDNKKISCVINYISHKIFLMYFLVDILISMTGIVICLFLALTFFDGKLHKKKNPIIIRKMARH